MPHLEVNGTTLYYEDEGGGRPLLWLHGWASSSQVWGAQLPEFVRDHRVVTVDWRGCGRSARPVRGNSVGGVIGDLVALIGSLALERPVVIGSSIGATFATELALRRPDLVAAVVVVDGPAYWPSTGMALDTLRASLCADRARTVADWVPHWFAPEVAPALVDWTVRQVLDSGTYIDEHFVGAAAYDPRPALPGLRVPIHYIHGERDTEIPVVVARDCAALTAGAGVNVISDAGHMPHQERPAVFNAALRAVLEAMAAVAPTAASSSDR